MPTVGTFYLCHDAKITWRGICTVAPEAMCLLGILWKYDSCKLMLSLAAWIFKISFWPVWSTRNTSYYAFKLKLIILGFCPSNVNCLGFLYASMYDGRTEPLITKGE